jgi:hypothetical protein
MANWQLLRDEMFKINFDGVIFGDINAFREINASGVGAYGQSFMMEGDN